MKASPYLVVLAAHLFCAVPASAQDRVSAYVNLFESWCLSRKADPARDWERAYPDDGRSSSQAFSVNGNIVTTYERIYDVTGLSLTQEQHSCAVSDVAPWLTQQEREAVLMEVTELMAVRHPSLQRKDDIDLGWDIHRVWTDGPAGTEAATWGVILMRVGNDLPGTTLTLALPRQ